MELDGRPPGQEVARQREEPFVGDGVDAPLGVKGAFLAFAVSCQNRGGAANGDPTSGGKKSSFFKLSTFVPAHLSGLLVLLLLLDSRGDECDLPGDNLGGKPAAALEECDEC